MAWSFGAVVISPDDRQDTEASEALYAVQNVIGGTESVINFYGAASKKRSLSAVMFESENSGSGLSLLNGYRTSGVAQTLTGDLGNEGTYHLVSLKNTRRQALNHTQAVWDLQLELLKAT